MSEVKFITTRYAGRVIDVVSYESTAILETPTTIETIIEGREEAKDALYKAHPTVFNVRVTVSCGFGFSHQTIVVIVAGEVYDCLNCGGEGHREKDCPHPKSE